MVLKKYISEGIIKKLNDKGYSSQAIEEKINEFRETSSSMGFTGEALEGSIKNRIKGFFMPVLRRNTKVMKAVIYGLSRPVDENDRIRRMSKLKEGESGYKPNTEYVVQEGFYPWGNQQGQEIPMDEQWEQTGFLGIENNKKIHNKEVKIYGSWLTDKKINKAKSGDVIRINVEESKLNNKMVYLNSYEYVEQLTEEKYIKLLDNLKEFHKTTSQIASENYNGFAIVKGSVGEIEGANIMSFDIIDNEDDWDVENSLTGSLKEVPFIAGAENLIFIGDVYKKGKGQPGYAINVQNVIVPEKYKKKDLAKENIDSIEESYNNDLGTSNNIDEDLL